MLDKHPIKACVLGALAALLLAVGILPDRWHSDPAQAACPSCSVRSSLRPASGNGFFTSPLVVPAAEFVSDGYYPSSTFFDSTGGYVRGVGTVAVSGGGCLRASVYLPPKAAIKSFYAYVYDNDADNEVTVTFQRIRTMTGVYDELGQVSTSSANTQIHSLGDETIAHNFTDNLHAYYLTTCLKTQNTRLYAVRIFYTFYRLYLPMTLK
jgi:hypothetical protein